MGGQSRYYAVAPWTCTCADGAAKEGPQAWQRAPAFSFAELGSVQVAEPDVAAGSTTVAEATTVAGHHHVSCMAFPGRCGVPPTVPYRKERYRFVVLVNVLNWGALALGTPLYPPPPTATASCSFVCRLPRARRGGPRPQAAWHTRKTSRPSFLGSSL